MNPWRWVDPRVHLIRLAHVQEYFRKQGWQPKSNPNPNMLRFERKARGRQPRFVQMVPASDDYDTFPKDVTELITTLSELEKRHPIDVLNDMLAAGRDQAVNGPEKNSRKKTARKGGLQQRQKLS
jgi:hypothetical protein